MQVSLEKKEGIHCVLSISIPSIDIDQEVSKRVKKMSKTSKLNGFRPGKVPLNLIRGKYGEQIRLEVIGSILPESYTKAIKDKQLNAAGVEVEILQNEEGKALKCKLNIELFPDVIVKDLHLVKIKKPIVELGEKEYKKMVNNLQNQLSTWDEIVQLQVNLGHKVIIDFVGYVDGKTFDGGSANELEVIIGSGQLDQELEKGIIGMSKDEEKQIIVTFSNDHPNEKLKDKTAKFDVCIKSVKKQTLPKVNEDFFKKLGIKGGEDAFHHEIKQNMARELKAAINRRIKSQVFDQLTKLIDIETPKILVKREVDRVRNELLVRIDSVKSKVKVEDIPDSLFEEKAKYDVKVGLIANAIIQKESLKADEASVNSMIEEMTIIYEDPKEVRTRTNRDEKELGNIKALIVENKLVDWVCQKALIEDKKEDFFDLVRDTSPQQLT
jgi:trigger factor